jgi:hypothetical protein
MNGCDDTEVPTVPNVAGATVTVNDDSNNDSTSDMTDSTETDRPDSDRLRDLHREAAVIERCTRGDVSVSYSDGGGRIIVHYQLDTPLHKRNDTPRDAPRDVSHVPRDVPRGE